MNADTSLFTVFMDRNKPVPPPTGPTVCPSGMEQAGPATPPQKPAAPVDHSKPVPPPTGPTVCPFRMEEAGPA